MNPVKEPNGMNTQGEKKIEHFGIKLEDPNNKYQANQMETQSNFETGSTSKRIKQEGGDSDSNTTDESLSVDCTRERKRLGQN